MATFEGPLLAIRSVNALAHYTDWIIGHVHSGTLGWNGFMAAGMIYWLLPRLWNKPLHSVALANLHFWIGLVGILLYISAMWTSGITQGLMLNGTTDNGTVLAYPNFLDTVNAIRPMMLMRVIGGGLYLDRLAAPGLQPHPHGARRPAGQRERSRSSSPSRRPTTRSWASRARSSIRRSSSPSSPSLFACVWMFGGDVLKIVGIVGAMVCVALAYVHYESRGKRWAEWYDRLLVTALPFTLLTLIAVVAGGLIQIIPTVVANQAANVEDRRQIPYTPLELAGRDLYISDGCYLCHSQMIRTLVPDVLRYGDYSRLGESIYDHPFQWGSKRNGPDLARVGGKYPNIWHLRHLRGPAVDLRRLEHAELPVAADGRARPVQPAPERSRCSAQLGVPYRADDRRRGHRQGPGAGPGHRRQTSGRPARTVAPDKEVIALIAYLQKLGKFEPVKQAVPETGSRLSD